MKLLSKNEIYIVSGGESDLRSEDAMENREEENEKGAFCTGSFLSGCSGTVGSSQWWSCVIRYCPNMAG